MEREEFIFKRGLLYTVPMWVLAGILVAIYGEHGVIVSFVMLVIGNISAFVMAKNDFIEKERSEKLREQRERLFSKTVSYDAIKSPQERLDELNALQEEQRRAKVAAAQSTNKKDDDYEFYLFSQGKF